MRLAAAVCLLAGVLQSQPAAPPLVLRFHHLHLRVADPASASRDVAAKIGGSRSMLQGHGLAVHAAGEYLVFDRYSDAQLTSGGSTSDAAETSAAYTEAIEWASRHGLRVAPADFREVGISGAVPAARVATMAFSAADPVAAIDYLSTRGLAPAERDESVAKYRVSPALVVEIMGETDRPDTHWCPMHPDRRAPGPARCNRCGMELVPIPPPRIGEYRLDVTLSSGSAGRATTVITLRVLDPPARERAAAFLQVHERPFHLFIISRDLQYFAHVHPEQ
jgi:hypothetical protein